MTILIDNFNDITNESVNESVFNTDMREREVSFSSCVCYSHCFTGWDCVTDGCTNHGL